MTDAKRTRRLFRLGSVGRDIDEELDFHFRSTIDELIAAGLSREEAETEARRRFGNEKRYRRELERIDRKLAARRRWWGWVAERRDDLRQAVRALSRSPGLVLGVTVTLALGIGANATMFGIIDRLLLQPPAHVEEPDRVIRLLVDRYVEFAQVRFTTSNLTYPDYQDFRGVGAFESVAAYANWTLTVGSGPAAHEVPGQLVSGDYFRTLGVRPAAGRFFGPAEDRRGAEGVAVISYGYWQRIYGGDPQALGSSLDLGMGLYTIVGIAPKRFTGPELGRVDVWLPVEVAAYALQGDEWARNREWWWIHVLARLAPGVHRPEAARAATFEHRRGRAEAIAAAGYDPEARVLAAPLIIARGPLAGGETRVAKWLAAVSALVLLIACANVANLLLARGVRHQRATAVRLALGASRRRLLGQRLLESLVLSGLGGVAALAILLWVGPLIGELLIPEVEWPRSGSGLRGLGFLTALAAVAGLTAGLLPALQASRRSLVVALKAGARGTSGSGLKLRSGLSAAQSGLCLILLVGAGLFIRSVNQVGRLDLGLDPERVVVAMPVLHGDELATTERVRLFQRVAERAARLPSIEAAAPTAATPFLRSIGQQVFVPGRDSIPSLRTGGPYVYAVGPDYFQTLKLRVLRGRGFRHGDAEVGSRVVVVNETMARLVWPQGDAIGECLKIRSPDAPCATVVGVVQDTRRHGLVESPSLQYYVPLAQALSSPPQSLLVRTMGKPEAMTSAIRQAFLDEPAVRFVRVRTLQEVIEPKARSWKLGASMFTVFGALALVVAAVGLYSVLAFGVAIRLRELGIRQALGATPAALVRLILRHALAVTGAGAAAGLVVALMVAPVVEPMLFRVSPRDPLVLASVAGLLALVAVAAGVLPALRAGRVDPMASIRVE